MEFDLVMGLARGALGVEQTRGWLVIVMFGELSVSIVRRVRLLVGGEESVVVVVYLLLGKQGVD